jgi:hypothetical protein
MQEARVGDRAELFFREERFSAEEKSMHFQKDQSNKAVGAGRASVRP